jgi:DNA-binding NtrC family response regulator
MNMPVGNTWHFINTSGVEGLISSLKGERGALHIEQVIRYDVVMKALNDGVTLDTILQKIICQLERYIINNILMFTDGNKSEAARILRINYKTLYYKIKKYADK